MGWAWRRSRRRGTHWWGYRRFILQISLLRVFLSILRLRLHLSQLQLWVLLYASILPLRLRKALALPPLGTTLLSNAFRIRTVAPTGLRGSPFRTRLEVLPSDSCVGGWATKYVRLALQSELAPGLP
jgi:hypothetical protein